MADGGVGGEGAVLLSLAPESRRGPAQGAGVHLFGGAAEGRTPRSRTGAQ